MASNENQVGFNVMRVRLTLLTPALGTCPGDEDIYRSWVASKAPEGTAGIEDQVAAIGVGEVIEKGKTVFPKLEDGTPILWAYQMKGFFKEACGFLRQVKGTESSMLTSYKQKIDGLVFPRGFEDVEDAIKIDTHGQPLGELQRSLRSGFPERTSLACSETVPAGSTIDMDIAYLELEKTKKSTADLGDAIREWLSYGAHKGLLQWRNGGKGKFTCDVIDPDTGELERIEPFGGMAL